MKNLVFVIFVLLSISCLSVGCSVVQRSVFSVDTVSAKNLHIQKTDSIQFKPFN